MVKETIGHTGFELIITCDVSISNNRESIGSNGKCQIRVCWRSSAENERHRSTLQCFSFYVHHERDVDSRSILTTTVIQVKVELQIK